MIKKYQNDDLIVYWEPDKCTHAGFCIRLLPGCFCIQNRPWVDINGETAEDIMETIDQCPSGALRYSFPEGSKVDPARVLGPGFHKIGE